MAMRSKTEVLEETIEKAIDNFSDNYADKMAEEGKLSFTAEDIKAAYDKEYENQQRVKCWQCLVIF